MRVLVQRVSEAQVRVDGEVVGAIGAGLLLLVGFRNEDTDAEVGWMARKCCRLRVFSDEAGKLNRSVIQAGGGILAVSQFTLYGDAQKGHRPSFTEACRPDEAERLYEAFCKRLADELGRPVATGRFGARMEVGLTNDGPVTIWLER